MTNSNRNGNFTHDEYKKLLQDLKAQGYEFTTFDQVKNKSADKPFVLMRHDIDMDLEPALKMAQLEHEEGVIATYFIMLRTDHYNIFTKENTERLNKIKAMGHHIALHFDCAAYPEHSEVYEFANACDAEVALLNNWLDINTSIVSYHRPNDLVLTGNPQLSGSCDHTYMEMFTKEIKYLSDSMGKWRFGFPTESVAFQKKQPLHILIHPIWWEKHTIPELDRLHKYVDQKTNQLKDSLASNCKVYPKREK